MCDSSQLEPGKAIFYLNSETIALTEKLSRLHQECENVLVRLSELAVQTKSFATELYPNLQRVCDPEE